MSWPEFTSMLADAALQPTIVMIVALCAGIVAVLAGVAAAQRRPHAQSEAGDTQAGWPSRLDANDAGDTQAGWPSSL